MAVNSELGGVWKEVAVAVAVAVVLLQHLCGRMGESHEICESVWCSYQDTKQAPPAHKCELLCCK
jgi:hypothetical protein